MTYDSDEPTKEVFAHFGLAFYLSGVFEAALTYALLTLDFLSAQTEEIQRNGKANFDRPKFEAEFDKFWQANIRRPLEIW